MQKIVIAGGTGFVGRALSAHFIAQGYEVVILSRGGTAPAGTRLVSWDGASVGAWASELEGARAVINLSGAPINKRWTPEYKKIVRDSRVKPTLALGDAIRQCQKPPAQWINASAVGYYGDTGEHSVSEASRLGKGFLAEVCEAWEQALYAADLPQTRRSAVRIGVVLGEGGGALDVLAKITKAFLGGAVGTGQQWMAWIHIEDLVALFDWILQENFAGAVNGVAPEPIRNTDFMAALRDTLGRPFAPPAPAFALQIAGVAMNMQTDLLLISQRVYPTIAPARGFQYRYPQIQPALAELLQAERPAFLQSGQPSSPSQR